MLDVACKPNTTGYCGRGESGSKAREPAEQVTLGDSDWYLEHVFSTSDFGMTFQKGSGLELLAFTDADYASKSR